jgi:predicted RNA-binding Zn ribbon-like protein
LIPPISDVATIDHSRPKSARWCSMAECGNWMKACSHHARQTSREIAMAARHVSA